MGVRVESLLVLERWRISGRRRNEGVHLGAASLRSVRVNIPYMGMGGARNGYKAIAKAGVIKPQRNGTAALSCRMDGMSCSIVRDSWNCLGDSAGESNEKFTISRLYV